MVKGYLLIASAAALWAMIGPVAKMVFKEGIQPMEVAFWRAMIAWLFFGVHAFLKKETKIQLKDVPMVALFAVTGISLFFGSYQLAIKNGGAAFAVVLLYTAPAWVAVMSRIFFSEMITAIKTIALLMTILGVALISFGAFSGSGTGGVRLGASALVFGLISGISYATYYIFGKHFSNRYSSPTLFLYMLPAGAAGLLPWVEFSQKSSLAWAGLISLAFFSTYGAFYCYYSGLKYLEPTRAAVAATLEPVIAAVIAYFWWNEYFSAQGYAGSCLILAGVVLMIWDGTRQPRV